MKKSFLILLFVFFFTNIFSQNHLWTCYNVSNSPIPSNCVNTMILDKYDNKWIGTHDGLAFFDGKNWKVFKNCFENDPIKSLALDEKNHLWIGTEGGLFFYDGNKINKIEIPLLKSLRYWVTRIIINPINNKIWFGTSRGLVCLDGMNWQLYTTQNSQIIDNRVMAMASDSKGNLWIGTFGYGISIFDGKNWKTINKNNSLLTENAAVEGIFFDSDNRPWVIDSQNQTYIYDINWKHLSLYTNQKIHTFAFDRLDNLWIGTFMGLGKFSDTKSIDKYVKVEMVGNQKKEYDYNSYEQMKVNYFTSRNSDIPDSDIQCIVIDKKNTIWIATLSGGIAYYENKNSR